MRHPAALLSLVVPVVLVAGCGGGSSPAALSKPDYVSKAEAICTTATTALNALTPPTAASGLAGYLDSTVKAASSATDALQALRPPAADAAALKTKFTGPLAAQVASVKKLIPLYDQAAKAANPQAALAEVPAPQLPRPDTAYLTSYGMPACAKLTQGQQ